MKTRPITSPTRRAFLRTGLGCSVAALLTPAVSALPFTRRGKTTTLVLVFLRGGMDGLNMVVPYGDEGYRRRRPGIAIPSPGTHDQAAIDLDGFFGLHPAARALHPLFADGTARALHAVGSPQNTRSHFEEQDRWETAVEVADVRAHGWLNRHLATTEGRSPVRAVSIGSSLPRSLRGDAPAIAVRGFDDLAFGERGDVGATMDALARAYANEDGPAAERLQAAGGRETLAALGRLSEIASAPYEANATYPGTDIGRRLREVARLIKSDLDLEIAALDYGAWDTHQYQGGFAGTFAYHTGELADGLAAFATDLDDALDDVLVLCVTEFGRTVAENGTGGTDHGSATCLLALGGPVVRRKSDGPVLGEWPGLARDELQDDRDLRLTTDYRDVLGEVLRGPLGNAHATDVLGGRELRGVGLV